MLKLCWLRSTRAISRRRTICGAAPVAVLMMMSSNWLASDSRPRALIGELEGLIFGHRRSAELSGDDLDILALDGGQDIRCREAESLEPVRVQPDPHAVRPGAEDPHLADAREPGQGVLQIDNGVVGEENLIKPVILGIEADHQQNVGGDLSDRDSLLLNAARKLGQGAVDQVLDQGQGGIEIGPDVEGDRQGCRSRRCCWWKTCRWSLRRR